MTTKDEYTLSVYEDLTTLGQHDNVTLVKNSLNDNIYVKKVLKKYNKDVYVSLKEHSIKGIPAIHEIIEDDGHLIVIEDYICGETLEYKYATGWDIETGLTIINHLCDILSCLHNLTPPIINRDIKPSNIIISNEGNIFIVDFNISRYYDEHQNRDTVILGTAGYASPEQCGFAQTDARSDIFSLGMLMKNLFVFKEPLDKTELKISNVINTCISIAPDKRYKNIFSLKSALNRAVKDKHRCADHPEIIQESCQQQDNSYLPPGFRSGKFLNEIIATVGYIMIFSISLTTEFDNVKSSHPFIESALMRICILAILLTFIAIIFNWRNTNKKLPLIKSDNTLVKILGYLCCPIITTVSYMFICALICAFIEVI